MNKDITPNPKCNVCKCYWKPNDTDIGSSGLTFKSCKKCRERQKEIREKNKCPHDKIKSTCRECKGSGFCNHDKIKSRCRECKGGSICPHDKIKSTCRECKGGRICPHDKHKSTCRECKGSSICPHDKQKSTCRECKGSSICPHDKIKSKCRECKGSSICPHNREKSKCRDCNLKLCLVNIQRIQINRCFKSSNLEKNKHSIEYLGCNIETFINYFQKKMDYFNEFIATDELMAFDNIHIDHIKPVSVFNLDDEDEFLDCCNYTNLQPLLKKDNLEKHNKWTDENEKYWRENIVNNDNYIEIYLI